MGNIKIDSEAANLIVQAYLKLNSLNWLLKSKTFPQLNSFIESGKSLGEMMNSAFDETTQNGLETKLSNLSFYLNSLLSYFDNIQNMKENREISDYIMQLIKDISLLQSKVNQEK